DVWVVKGEAMPLREEWEEAVRVFERAFESSGRSDRDVRLQKAQRLLKQSRHENYCKVLGVARNADAKTINRKVAMTAHPDKGSFEAKMAQVNEAYEVLTNPGGQLFTINTFRFDNRDNPNDPGSQGGVPPTGYGSPFDGGGDHPFAVFPAGWAARVLVW
ncbi:hypothetical protein M405DRAFT_833643, partial [Rhizopogon salebrosus TDB-379]